MRLRDGTPRQKALFGVLVGFYVHATRPADRPQSAAAVRAVLQEIEA